MEFLKTPERSEWRCELFGTGPDGITMRPEKGKEPNWFWRWMQFLCFGNRWVKKAMTLQTDEELAPLEREHFGDPDLQTGIYAPIRSAAETSVAIGDAGQTPKAEV